MSMYQPNTKLHLRENLSEALLGLRKEQLYDELILIQMANRRSTGKEGFTYKGKQYYTSTFASRLDQSLHESMDAYLVKHNQFINYTTPMVKGYLIAIMNLSDNPKDWIKLLHDFFHETVINFFGIIDQYPETKFDDAYVEAFNKKYASSLDCIAEELTNIFVQKFCNP